jgi:hypothetical protein
LPRAMSRAAAALTCIGLRSVLGTQSVVCPSGGSSKTAVLQGDRGDRGCGRRQESGQDVTGLGLDGAGSAELTHQPGGVIPLDRARDRLCQVVKDSLS